MRAFVCAAATLSVTVLVVAATVAGCKDPAPPNGAITCGPGGTCPTGYSCVDFPGGIRTCYRSGELPDLAPDQARDTDGGDPCQDYCDCVLFACAGMPGLFTGEGDCLSKCGALMQQALICRTLHCTFARDGYPDMEPADPVRHCPHALGQNVCP